MTKTMSIKALRPALPAVIDGIDRKMDRYVITKRGKPAAIMMGVDDYESLLETLDILTDKETMTRLKQGERDIAAGKTRSWKEFKKRNEKVHN
jgi:antitoxin YefM